MGTYGERRSDRKRLVKSFNKSGFEFELEMTISALDSRLPGIILIAAVHVCFTCLHAVLRPEAGRSQRPSPEEDPVPY